MKRDMDLIRNILRFIDASEDDDAITEIKIDRYSHQEIAWHVLLLNEAGIIRAKIQSDEDAGVGVSACSDAGSVIPDAYEIFAITREGYAFLDAFSNEARWKKAKGLIGDIGDAPIHLVIPLFMELLDARII